MDACEFPASIDDPRVTRQFCRRLPGADGDVTLLGVVHDHPASVGRVERVLEVVDPETVALELPPAAVPLYEAYARDAATQSAPPRFGGEMSAAIRAAPDAEVVGIDAPNWSFLRRLLTRLVADRASAETARRVVSSLGAASREALTCRIAATVTNATSMTVARDEHEPIEYDCDHDDPPERQAAHERSHVAGVRALLGGVDDGALAYRDDTREECMVDRLETLRHEAGDVVAVVGIDHLETIADELA